MLPEIPATPIRTPLFLGLFLARSRHLIKGALGKSRKAWGIQEANLNQEQLMNEGMPVNASEAKPRCSGGPVRAPEVSIEAPCPVLMGEIEEFVYRHALRIVYEITSRFR
jgi:hypothetical protein